VEVNYRISDRKRHIVATAKAVDAFGQNSPQPSLYAQASTLANLGYYTLRALPGAVIATSQTFDNLGYYLPVEDLNQVDIPEVSANTVPAGNFHLPRLAIKHAHPQIFTRSSPNYFKTY